jgi:uncharacterized repeat protein (TIGR01451 family)
VRNVDDLVRAARLVLCIVVIGGGLFLLCACAKQEPPTGRRTDALLPTSTAISTPIPTYTPLPTDAVDPHSPSPSELLTTASTVTDSGPSDADLSLGVSGPVQVFPGETALYTLTVHNHGPAPATSIVLTDMLPTGLIPVWTQSVQPVCGRQERSVRCELGDLGESDAVTVTLDLSVGGTESLVTSTQLAGVTLDLSTPTCTIVQDSIPTHVTCRLARLQPGADAHVRIGVGVDAWAKGPFVHTATVAANEADANRSNNRAVFTMTVGSSGPVPSQVEGPATAPVTPPAIDLVVQADGPSSVIAGQPFTYAFTIANQGSLDATGVRFENVLPPATTLEGYAPGLPLCEQRDDTLTCTLRDPDGGETVTFTLVITGHAGQPMIIEPDALMPGWPICTVLKERTYLHIVQCELGELKRGQATHVQLALTARGVQERTIANVASVSVNEANLNPLENAITATIAVQVRADLLVRSALSGPAVAGETLSYTLTAVNLGPSDADVILTDTLPMGARLISAVSSRGDECHAERKSSTTDTLTCDLGRLNGGETASVTIVVAMDESLALAKELSHSARVVTVQADPNPGNNVLTESIPVSSRVED